MLRFHTLRRVRGSADMRRLDKVTEFFLHEFPSGPQYMDAIREKLTRPLTIDYAVTLVTAETGRGEVRGFGVYDHFPDAGFSYLEYLVASPRARGQGVGGGIYEAMRERLVYDGARGLLFEVNADDDSLPPEVRRANAATLRFYERYDARPLEGVRFDYPPFGDAPHLLVVHDDLGTGTPVTGERLRRFFRRLYTSKYPTNLDDPHVQRILDAVPNGTLRRRALRYVKPRAVERDPHPGERLPRVQAFASTAHRKLVVPERDHLERPLRAERLLAALRAMPLVHVEDAKAFPDSHLLAVHDAGMVRYLKHASASLAKDEVIHPTAFPVRRRQKPPSNGHPTHAGYYSLDSFTPLTSRVYEAARAAVNVALTGARELRQGPPEGPVYALTRPPGHHAERDLFGGFCYFNNGAVAANYLAQDGRVAILDIDHHHGNGAQQIFWERDDVLTVSVHGDPRASYPYFTGFPEERGAGAGLGYNHNLTLPEGADDDSYLRTLKRACRIVRDHEPQALVLALGLDISKDDPSGTFRVSRKGFHAIGRALAALEMPTLIVQEGGYNLRNLGGNLTAFLDGWMTGPSG